MFTNSNLPVNPHQCRVDEARCRPGLWRDEVVEGEVLLGVNWRDVVGRVACMLGIWGNLHRPVTVLWHESVDSDCLCLYPRLVE